MDQQGAISLALEGKERGFQWLFERHRNPLYRFVRRQAELSAEAADDILQNVFIRAFRSLASLRDAGAFDAWILQIARRESLS